MADLGSLLEKLGRSAGLQNSEIAQLRSKGTALDRLEAGAASHLLDLPYSLDVDYLSARHGVFGEIPFEMARLGTNTNQTITTATVTILKPADAISATGPTLTNGLTIDPTEGSVDLKHFDSPSIFLVMGHVQFAAHATGQRYMSLFDADSGDPGTENFRIDEDDAASAGGRILNAAVLWRNAGTNGDNLRLGVYQNSGGDLDVDHWRFSIIRIH